MRGGIYTGEVETIFCGILGLPLGVLIYWEQGRAEGPPEILFGSTSQVFPGPVGMLGGELLWCHLSSEYPPACGVGQDLCTPHCHLGWPSRDPSWEPAGISVPHWGLWAPPQASSGFRVLPPQGRPWGQHPVDARGAHLPASQELSDRPWSLSEDQLVCLYLVLCKQVRDVSLVLLHRSQEFLSRYRVEFLLRGLPFPLFRLRGGGEGRYFPGCKGFNKRSLTALGMGSSRMFCTTSWRVGLSGYISASNWSMYSSLVTKLDGYMQVATSV